MFKRTKLSKRNIQRFNITGYKRLLYILDQFAKSYWKFFVTLFLLNLLIFVVGMLQTVFTAATIDAITGQYLNDAVNSAGGVATPNFSFFGLSLNNIGTVAYEWLGVGKDPDRFKIAFTAGLLAFVGELLRIAISFGVGQLSALATQKVSINIQNKLFEHYLNFSIGFFNRNKAGNLISRMESDAVGSVSGIQSMINSFVVAPLMIIFYLILTINASWVLFFSIVIAGLAHHFLSMMMSKSIQSNTKKGLDIGSSYRSMLMEAFTAIRVVKSFAAERFELNRITGIQKEVIINKLRAAFLGGIQSQSRGVINATVKTVIISFCAYELFVNKTINVSSCLLFIYICNQVVQPINTFSGGFMSLQNMITNCNKVYKYFKTAPDVKEGNQDIREFKNQIEYKKVGFSYEKKPVLQNINLKINKGETVALVGPSGAGKSTFVDLALRFYDPKEGMLLIDGSDLRDFKQTDYRRLFGVISQESILFNATIRENIGYAREGITQAQIEAAAKVANAYDFIMDTPLGFDTYVGDRGIRLSGGQRQRIAIARAVVGNPQILIMDEATSSLDSESEREVQKAIKQVTQNMTAIIIAHRLSTVVHAHKIVVLEKGHIVDVGSHRELLGRCELYQNLYKHQFEIQEPIGAVV